MVASQVVATVNELEVSSCSMGPLLITLEASHNVVPARSDNSAPSMTIMFSRDRPLCPQVTSIVP